MGVDSSSDELDGSKIADTALSHRSPHRSHIVDIQDGNITETTALQSTTNPNESTLENTPIPIINGKCEDDNSTPAEPTAKSKENLSMNQFPVNNHIDDSDKAIVNLQKQIEEYNKGLSGEDSNVVPLGSVQPPTTQDKATLDSLLTTTSTTSSTSESPEHKLKSRLYRSEPEHVFKEPTKSCDIDSCSPGCQVVVDEDDAITNLPFKTSTVKSVKRHESSYSVLQRSDTTFSYFNKKFQSLTFRRKNKQMFSMSHHSTELSAQLEGSYKKASAQAIVAAIQLGIAYSVGKFSAKPDRDILLQDFFQLEEVYFPSCGTTYTPSHRFSDFTMSDYSPVAFRYFRDIFSISPEDFMTSLSTRPLRQLSNPGASGSMFFVSEDDIFIIKTVDKREAKFLQQLLPGYYMNLHQNAKTLLPKFFGLYSYKYSGRNIRLVVMNNLMPSRLQFHEKYDLKGSTYKRKASQKERSKILPTLKDLDFIEKHPNGFELSHENHQRLLKTLQRDIRVLQSYKIMDYSLLLCVHNKAIYEQHKLENFQRSQAILTKSTDFTMETPSEPTSIAIEEEPSSKCDPKLPLHQSFNDMSNDNSFDIDEFLKNGIPAKNSLGEDLIVFVGVIDILQNYRLIKRTEHNLKAIVYDRDSISVHNPVFYAERFLSFCSRIFQVAVNSNANEHARTNTVTNKQLPQQKLTHAISSTSQPVIGTNDSTNKSINLRAKNVNKFIDNV